MSNYLLSLSKAYLKSFTGLPFACWRGIFSSLTESILMGVFYFLPIYFVETLHLNIAISGKIMACYGLGAIAGGFIGGKVSDKTSPGYTSAFSLFIQAAGYLFLIKLKSITLRD